MLLAASPEAQLAELRQMQQWTEEELCQAPSSVLDDIQICGAFMLI